MVWKVIAKSSPGDSGKFGADDIDKYSKLLRGDADVDTCDINSTFGIRHGKGRILSSGGTNPIIWNTAATATRTQTFPDETGTIITSATGVTLTGAQTLTNKTISGASNTLSNIPSSALPATVVENDQNNDLGDFYVELGDIAAPSDPASGKIRLFLNSATGELSVRKAAGTTVSLEATGGGGGSWDPAAVETLTNKTIAFANNTLTGVASLTTAQTLTNKTITFADNTLTNVASINTAQTISAVKTFSSAPVISTITNTGTLTLPTSTDTLVGRATTDTLTNKTVSGASNTLSNIPKGAIPAATLYNDVDNALGAHYADVGEIAVPSNPAADVRRVFVNSATGKLSVRTDAGTTISLEEQPNWSPSATETLTNKTIAYDDNTLTDVASVDTAQTLTNKTVNFANNTLTGVASTTTAQTLTGKTITFTDNTLTDVASTNTAQTLTNKTLTTPVIATIKPDASNSLNLPVTTDTLVALTNTQTLTNKTVAFANNTLTDVASTNTAQTFTTAAKTFNNNMLKLNDSAADHAYTITAPDLADNRNLSLPLLTGDDTMVTTGTGLSTGQTLTNKTMDAASNTFQRVLVAPEIKFTGGMQIGGVATTGWGQTGTFNTIGTVSNFQNSTVGTTRRFATTTTVDSQAGVRYANATFVTSQKPRMRFRFRLNQATDKRFYILFTNTTGNFPTAAATDVINNLSGFGFALRTGDTNYHIAHNDGTGAGVYDDSGIAPDTDTHTLELYADSGVGFKWQYDGGTITNVSTEIPAAGDALGMWMFIETSLQGAAKNFDVFWHWMEWNNLG